MVAAFDSWLQILNILAYGAIAAYMYYRASIGLTPPYAKLAVGVHFNVTLVRLGVTLFWQDSPTEWGYIHRVTAVICMLAIAYEIGRGDKTHA